MFVCRTQYTGHCSHHTNITRVTRPKHTQIRSESRIIHRKKIINKSWNEDILSISESSTVYISTVCVSSIVYCLNNKLTNITLKKRGVGSRTGAPVDVYYICCHKFPACCHPMVNSGPRVAGMVTAVTTPSISPAPAPVRVLQPSSPHHTGHIGH